MRARAAGWLLAALPALAPASGWAAQCYEVDAGHAAVAFEIEQAGAPFHGEFRRFGGEICLSDGAVSRIDVHLDPGSVDTGLPELDAALRGEAFFAVDHHPDAHFTSKRIERGANGFVAHGTLDLKGITRPLDAGFTLERAGDGYAVAGALAFDRLDFEVGTGEWADTTWVGNRVRVTYRARLAPAGG